MIKQLLKKVLIIYLVVIACVFTPTYRAYAASAGGWAFSAFDVATSVVTALKNGASASVAVAKSPISQKIAKGIVGGAIAGAALPLAISQISGIALNAIDWVLDPANNAVKYKDKSVVYDGFVYAVYGYPQYYAYSPELVCTDLIGKSVYPHYANYTFKYDSTRGYYGVCISSGVDILQIVRMQGPTAPTDNWKTIPIPTVANKVYDNAKTDSDSRSVVNDAVKEYVNEGSADTALDRAKADADEGHSCGTGTHWSGSACVADTPTTPTTPDTPFDPSGIIDAIKSVFDAVKSVFDAVMSLPDVINNALDDLLVDIKDFLKSEPTPENPTQPDVTTLPTPPTDSVNISFDGGCPAPKVVPWSFAGRNIDITIPYTPVCDTAILLNPLIKLAASLGAVFIVAGIRRGDDG